MKHIENKSLTLNNHTITFAATGGKGYDRIKDFIKIINFILREKQIMKTYWNQNGKYQEQYDEMSGLIPDSGKSDNQYIELFRNMINLYSDLYTNGGGNWQALQYQLENLSDNKKSLFEESKKQGISLLDHNSIFSSIKAIMDDAWMEEEGCPWHCDDYDDNGYCDCQQDFGLDSFDFDKVSKSYETLADIVICYVFEKITSAKQKDDTPASYKNMIMDRASKYSITPELAEVVSATFWGVTTGLESTLLSSQNLLSLEDWILAVQVLDDDTQKEIIETAKACGFQPLDFSIETHRLKFKEIYQKTLPDFNSDVNSEALGEIKLTQAEANSQAQSLYDKIVEGQINGSINWSMAQLCADGTDIILKALGVKLKTASGLVVKVDSPYYKGLHQQMHNDGLQEINDFGGDTYNMLDSGYFSRFMIPTIDFMFSGMPLQEASSRLQMLGLDIEINPKQYLVLGEDESLYRNEYRRQSVITEQEKTSDKQLNAYTFIQISCVNNTVESKKRLKWIGLNL
jgi:hypothetical protein